ncbi:Hypothetical predicted protein [Pelobates cultripes]|uniref:Uncharacterized protein n=1 Tax=Pelobates cultripes TaxID=61616 RepID=A0AAD1WEZ3_PELCU|nr:Hypothetical predicted protein [Pelobates cultripes]
MTTCSDTPKSDRHLSPWEEHNHFIKAAANVYKSLDLCKPCWVCGHTPHAHDRGYPYFPKVLTKKDLLYIIRHNVGFYFLISNDTSEVPKIFLSEDTRDRPGAVKLRMGEWEYPDDLEEVVTINVYQKYYTDPSYQPNVQSSSYVNTMALSPFYTAWSFDYFNGTENGEKRTEGRWKYVLGEGEAETISRWWHKIVGTGVFSTYFKFKRSNVSCINHPIPSRGFYWLCGRWADKKLPCKMKIDCTLGMVMPAIYPTKTLPENTHQHWQKRDTDLSGFKMNRNMQFWVSLFPMVGVGMMITNLNLLIDTIDDAFNSTGFAISLLNYEQEQIRQVALQNRIALDYLLAAEGGVCKRIGGKACCVWIEDKSGKVKHELQHLEEIQKRFRKPLTTDDLEHWLANTTRDFDWTFGIGSWIGGLGMKILKGIVWCVFIILCIYLCYKLTICCIQRVATCKTNASIDLEE